MQREIKNKSVKKTPAGESGSAKSLPLPGPGTVNSDPAGASYMTYHEQIKSPQWQKKRLEIFERDFYSCRNCYSKEKTLHVHHIFYLSSYKVWEYPNEFYVTLCEDCHKIIHNRTEFLFKTIVKHNDDIGSDGVVRYIEALSMACKITWEQMIAYSEYLNKIHGEGNKNE